MTERISWKDSNLALIGSELDHKIKAATAEGEPQWDGLGESAGFKVWRIEQFRVVPWPTDQYGHFHTGDSYVVLNSYLIEGESDKLHHDLHIWIGAESSQDEYGTAAYKMVEADDALGGAAVQHREVQGRESDLFRSYFSNGITILDGGAASGFTHVEASVDAPHLYRVKGATAQGMSLTQVPLRKSSLNAGDSFILFANASTVYVWHGASANPNEKNRANTVAENTCKEGTVVALEQDQDDGDEGFWAHLGEGEIAAADEGDEAVEVFAPLLFKVTGDDELEQVAKGEPVKMGFGPASAKISRSCLSAGDVYVLDGGWEVFVWIGADADRSAKVAAMARADTYCKQDPRTADIPLWLVKSGYEPTAFNDFFFD